MVQSPRGLLPELTSRGIKLVIVSGDIIEGTITPKLLNRQSRGLIQARLDQVGYIPTVADFAGLSRIACTQAAALPK